MAKENNHYEIGFNLAIENALRLHKHAGAIAEDDGFGAACSLNMLAAEEAIKAMFLKIQSFEVDLIEDFDKIFKDHTTKHKYIKEFLHLHSDQLEYFEHYLAPLKEIIKLGNVEVPDLIKSGVELIDRQAIRNKCMPKILDWLENANTNKNNGFYVGLKNRKWYCPSSYTIEKYETESQYCGMVISLVTDFNNMSDMANR